MISSEADPRSSTTDASLLASASPAALAYVTSQGRWQPYEHVLFIDDYILRVAAREITRLIIEVPVRHGKSELVSRYTPAWWLGRYPDDQVMLAGYEATFARSWGRKARDILVEHGRSVFGVEVADTPAAADWWMIRNHEGVMVTAGVGGALTGKGADLLLVDDPVKNAEEAQSEVYRDKTWDWWQSTARSRLQPGGRVIVVMARWHEDDFVGRLLAEDDDEWTVISLPALARENDPMGRAPGEALCPEMFDERALERARREIGSYWFSALYQQEPAPPEGFLFKRRDFRYWREEIERIGDGPVRRWLVLADDDGSRRFDAGHCVYFQTVDAAISSKETADFTVVSTWCATPDGDLLLLDLERRHFEQQQTVQFLAAAADKHQRPPMWIERFGAGRSPLATLARLGYPVSEIPVEAGAQLDKVTRAFGAVALLERHKLFFPPGQPDWLAGYESELASFPNATHDDQVDVTSYAARLLPQLGIGTGYRAGEVDGPRPLSAGIRSVQF